MPYFQSASVRYLFQAFIYNILLFPMVCIFVFFIINFLAANINFFGALMGKLALVIFWLTFDVIIPQQLVRENMFIGFVGLFAYYAYISLPVAFIISSFFLKSKLNYDVNIAEEQRRIIAKKINLTVWTIIGFFILLPFIVYLIHPL